MADSFGGMTCHVEQGHYGHRARKMTWLYAVRAVLPDLQWGPSDAVAKWAAEYRPSRRALARAKKDGVCVLLSHRERAATPVPFRDMLLAMARSVT